jgi:ubiquinone/menaquinone biosynthesis C-methylase UbiE
VSLRHSYTFFAPIYDLVVARATEPLRRNSLARLEGDRDEQVLIAGIGSGLDIPLLPQGPRYVGLDLTPAMLQRARARAAARQDIELREGDVMALPCADGTFDTVIMHLILAVVPEPERALREAERVLKPGGRILLLDKFLRPGQHAPLRRLLNLLTRHVATRTDVVFEDVLKCCSALSVTSDSPALAGGWFRYIELHKKE